MEGSVNRNHDVYLVPGLRRGLMVLETIASAGRPMTVSEIGAALSLTRSSVFRLTYTLKHLGFLEADENAKTFALGPRVLNIGFAYLASRDIIEVATPDLELLRDRTNVSSHLAIRDGREVLFLSCVQTRSGFLSNMNVGTRLPAYAAPMGWFLLSDLSTREISALFEGQKLTAMTDQTPRDLVTLRRKISESRAAGYVVSRGIMEKGGSSISAPLLDRSGQVVAAIDVSGPDSAFGTAELDRFYVDEVVAAAKRISERLGYSVGAQGPTPSITPRRRHRARQPKASRRA